MSSYITVGFVALSVFLFGAIAIQLKKHHSSKAAFWTLLIPALWSVVIFIEQRMGLLEGMELPPKIPLFVVVPTFILWVSILIKKSSRSALLTLPLNFLVGIQAFRIGVESLFHAMYLEGTFPIEGTFMGENYDMYAGISALLMWIVMKFSTPPKTVLYIWNTLGMLILLNTVRMFITVVYGADDPSQGAMAMEGLNKYPGLLVPSLLMPGAIFLHVLTFLHLRKR